MGAAPAVAQAHPGHVPRMQSVEGAVAGAPGGPGLAIHAAKILTCTMEGPAVFDNAVLTVKDGKIEAVGAARDVTIPGGYEDLDLGDRWLMPGMIDLHCHIGGTFDINDGIFLANPGLRASTAVRPYNSMLQMAVRSGVTTVLFIPGSGTNVGGQGVLLKTGHEHYDDAEVRNPGSLKVAQWGNPERWLFGPGKTFENYTIRNIFTRGRAYAKLWSDHDGNGGPAPQVDPQLEIFRHLFAGDAQVSVHTQIYQVVVATIMIIKGEMDVDVYIDHGTFDGYLAAPLAAKMGVNAILGPRNVDAPNRGIMNWVGANPERIQGVAAGYQERGHPMIGFNTDSPVIPQEELFLQASMAVRHGFKDDLMQTVRGLTIVPAVTAGIDDRVGCLAVGRDADIVVLGGHPADPRTQIERVFIDGVNIYERDQEHQVVW
ncbi:amidohydrolase family protein [Engelhardtia mirabilis]